MIGQLLPWAMALLGSGGAMAFARLWLIERGKLRLDEIAAGTKLLTEHAERMSALVREMEPFRESEFHRRECCRIVVALLRGAAWGDWISAERDAVAFIRREGRGAELDGITFASELEI